MLFGFSTHGHAGHMADAHPIASEIAFVECWIVMIGAMMLPTLIDPIRGVRATTLARRRLRATLLFVGAYFVAWTIFGVVALFVLRLTKTVVVSRAAGVWLWAFVALAWQLSPIKQLSLNRCHQAPTLRAFGRLADFDSFVFGLRQGGWCVSSCWALMIVPMLLPSYGQLLSMIAITMLVFCERLERPQIPSWRMRGFGRVGRMVLWHAGLM